MDKLEQWVTYEMTNTYWKPYVWDPEVVTDRKHNKVWKIQPSANMCTWTKAPLASVAKALLTHE